MKNLFRFVKQFFQERFQKSFKYYIQILLLTACTSGLQSQNPQQPLPFDPQIKQGQLANGLRYYIMPNADPVERVYIRLVINAGSMHEDDDQKGVAHIVEHMAFNGSEKYPENQIINALEQLGMKFARDINAFTDFENTVYTLNIAKNDPKRLALAFDVVDQWMNHLTMLPKDLDAERGVVLEEWRARLSPMLRLGDKKSEIEMAGSRYVQRDPIGDVNIIKNVSAQRVADFYHRWYRPDNMALVVVGDISTKQIEDLIQQKFSPMSKPSQPLPTIDFAIPIQKQWRLATLAEQELHSASLELSFFQPALDKNTQGDYQQDLIEQIMIRLLNLRLQDWEQNNGASIGSANFYHNYLGKQNLQSIFSLQLDKPDYEKQVKKLFQFIAEIYQQGFSQAELNGELERLTKLNEKQRQIKAGSLKRANDLIVIAANQTVQLGDEDKYQLNKKLLTKISLSQVNQAFNQLMDEPSRLLMIVQPYPAKNLSFNQQQVAQWWTESLANKSQLTSSNQKIANSENSATENLPSEKSAKILPPLSLQAGSMKLERISLNEKTGFTVKEFRLSNGSKLVYHYSDKNPNQVYFKALTSGGLRSIPKADYQLLRSAINVVDETGIGEIAQADVRKLFDSPVAFTTFIDDYAQGFTSAGKSADLENLLKLFRLKLEKSPVSQQALQKFKQENKEYFANLDVEGKFVRDVYQQRFPNQETVYSQNPKQLQSVTQMQLAQAYQHYINDKTDFTYFIVGDIDETELEKLANLYLASVPVKSQTRTIVPLKAQTPAQFFVMKGLKEPRAEVETYLTLDLASINLPWRAENEYLLDIIADTLQEKLRLSLREKASGVYSVNTWFNQDMKNQQLEGKIEFSCAPERVKELIQLSELTLTDFAENGIEKDLLVKKIREKITQVEQSFDSLLVILSMLEQSEQINNSPVLLFKNQQIVEQPSDELNIEQINKLAQDIFRNAKKFSAILTH